MQLKVLMWSDEEYNAAKVALQQKLGSVYKWFSCGYLIFDDDHHLSKIIVQKKNLMCESWIEKGYYTTTRRES